LPAVWYPGTKYFLGLNAISMGGMGWVWAIIGAFGTVLLCELYELYAKHEIAQFKKDMMQEKEEEKKKVDVERKVRASQHFTTKEAVQGIAKKDLHSQKERGRETIQGSIHLNGIDLADIKVDEAA